ncbi:MAG TPA: dihydroorotase family protein [Candidatus Dormibacteraeota bacterium]|nr:dihydroorotase family protein [Candidatus Dormibacteraeota bacterium]
MSSTLIETARILVGEELTTANILVEDGKIKKISKLKPTTRPDSKINANHLIALPGMIDAHVHLRDLELSYKETFETGTQAAAVGGYTTVFDMPNTRPPTTTAARLAQKISQAKGHLYSNVAFQGSLTTDEAELQRMLEHGAIAFKLYLNKTLETFDSSDQTSLSTALHAARKNNALVTVHAEDGDMIHRIQEKNVRRGRTSIHDFLNAHPPQAETAAVRRIAGLSKQVGVRVHVCHITLPSSVKLIRRTPTTTCEASAHHLLLNHAAFCKFGTLAICVPPIRAEIERSGLWKLFAQGEVDILASDHAPHTIKEKTETNAFQAASGIPGLETSLPLMFTQVSRGKLSLRRLIEATAVRPAKIFHLPKKGALREGFDADIVLVNPKAKSTVNPKKFLSKAKFTPFKGSRCTGTVAYTVVNGVLVAEDGKIVGPPAGKITRAV